MAYRTHELVLDPDGFFEKESRDTRLWIPAFVVLLVGLVRISRGLYTSNYVSSAMEGGAPAGGAGVMRYVFMLPSIITPFVSWLVIGVVIIGVCTYLGGEGGASDTFAVAGWGFVPALVGALVTFGLTVYLLSGTDPSGMQEAFDAQQTVFETVRSMEMRAFSYVLVGWQAFIWSFGVKHVHDIGLKRAAVPAAVAAALVVAWDLFGNAVLLRIMGAV